MACAEPESFRFVETSTGSFSNNAATPPGYDSAVLTTFVAMTTGYTSFAGEWQATSTGPDVPIFWNKSHAESGGTRLYCWFDTDSSTPFPNGTVGPGYWKITADIPYGLYDRLDINGATIPYANSNPTPIVAWSEPALAPSVDCTKAYDKWISGGNNRPRPWKQIDGTSQDWDSYVSLFPGGGLSAGP
jgi:hypothetical protein